MSKQIAIKKKYLYPLLVALLGLPLIFILLALADGNGFLARTIETLMGEVPDRKVHQFVDAIILKNENVALAIWELPDWQLANQNNLEIQNRRNAITKQLIDSNIQGLEVTTTEWWRTCCEPAVTNDPRNAGGARIHVQLLDTKGEVHPYIFDVFVRDTTYWGAAQGYPIRQWILRDVYLENQDPLFFSFT